MMIKTITMRSCASYDDHGISLLDCNKVNFIYGHNGSGKSTISNFLQGTTPELFQNCHVEWELGTETDILVYNKTFRQKNLKSMPGVFTLGEATAEQLKHIEELKELIERRREELIATQSNIQKEKAEKEELYQSFEKTAWNTILKKNETDFLDAFTGLRSKKALFAGKVLETYRKKPTTEESRDSLVEKAKVLFGKKPDNISIIEKPDLTILENIEKDEIWGTVIVGNKDVDIAALIETLNNSDWVKAGMKYIDVEKGICPFCQKQTISQDLINQLEQFFSGEYERKIKRVEEQKEQYIKQSAILIQSVNTWVASAKVQNVEFDFVKIEELSKSLKYIIEKNEGLFSSKAKEPSRCITPDNTTSVLAEIDELINSYNERVVEHNLLANDFARQKKALIDDIWAFLVSENSTIIKAYSDSTANKEKALEGMKRKESSLVQQIKSIRDQIVEESKNVTSVQPTVDAINRALKAYGFDGFEIVAATENPNQYQILRPNGMIATDSLSEGEETFISFLYFVYMTRGGLDTEKINKHKVIVIDDPICSLDSSILYVVSSLVRELISYAKKGTNNIDQVFVLTHNVYFHKEVSFQDGRNQTDTKVSFWVLNKKNEITSARAYNNTNPITTSYALLWKEVKEADAISSVSLQNAMRRILESFFGTLGNANIDEILQFFDYPEEKSICRSLFSWANDGSHSIPDDLEFSEDNDSREKFKKVFKDIFYNTRNQYHYDRMMR